MLAQKPYLRAQGMKKEETDLPLGAICPVWEAIRVKLATVCRKQQLEGSLFRPK